MECTVLFDFLEKSDQQRYKIAIGQFLSHHSVQWTKGSQLIAIEELNGLSRIELAKKYLESDGIRRLGWYITEARDKAIREGWYIPYKDISKYPKDASEFPVEKLLRDVAMQIDYKIPSTFYVKKRDFKHGYEDHSITKGEYRGIHTLDGLRFHYVENYAKESAALFSKTPEVDFLKFIRAEISERGYQLKREMITEAEAWILINFAVHGEECERLFEIVEYE